VTQQPNPELHKKHRSYVLHLLNNDTSTSDNESITSVYVFYNGEILGRTKRAKQLVSEVQLLAIGDQIHEIASSVVTFDGHLYISTDEGRVVRPLLSVNWCKTTIRPAEQDIVVDKLIRTGGLRYLDAAECSAFDIAWTYDILVERMCDFMEIHPHLMLGVTAACIPFLQCPGQHS
jgi:DNA-directed RNA polymerase beta subunit